MATRDLLHSWADTADSVNSPDLAAKLRNVPLGTPRSKVRALIRQAERTMHKRIGAGIEAGLRRLGLK